MDIPKLAAMADNHNGRGLTLPSIATMTQGLPPDPRMNGQSSFDTRDSGNWSMQSQSKRRCSLLETLQMC